MATVLPEIFPKFSEAFKMQNLSFNFDCRQQPLQKPQLIKNNYHKAFYQLGSFFIVF